MTELQPFTSVLLDIEGTTTPIRFVYDVLFPYVRDHVEGYLNAHWGEDALQADVELLRDQARQDRAAGVEGAIAIPGGRGAGVRVTVLASIRWLMDNDRKVTGLKSLQGKIWRAGYEDGSLQAELFDDVPEALERWSERGARIFIYSSGSIAAQKLLFGHTESGDWTEVIEGYFDTTTGHKREVSSYEAIAEAIGDPPGQILFLTDVVGEADAAREAGLQAAIMDRPGNHPQPDHDHPVLEDFSEL